MNYFCGDEIVVYLDYPKMPLGEPSRINNFRLLYLVDPSCLMDVGANRRRRLRLFQKSSDRFRAYMRTAGNHVELRPRWRSVGDLYFYFCPRDLTVRLLQAAIDVLFTRFKG